MELAVREMITAMVYIMQVVPIGTNLGLCRMVWAMVRGGFLVSRGAVHGALEASGFAKEEIRESWQAMRYGSWEINEMLMMWTSYVKSGGKWKERRYGMYRVRSVDMTGFWRPRLQGKVGKHYHALAQKAMPAIVNGIMVSVGEIGGRRMALLERVVRCPSEQSESAFIGTLLRETVKVQAVDEVVALDGGFELSVIQASKLKRFVVRMAINCTARLNQLPASKNRGRHSKYGEKVRPLRRTFKDRSLLATRPHRQGCFRFQGRIIPYQAWQGLVTSSSKVSPDNPTFTIYLFSDPLFQEPLLLATDLPLDSFDASLIYAIYRDRWPVEHPPLVTKQLIGLHRQFVHASDSCFRLPELALLAGNLLTYVAAILPPTATGFWDHFLKPTPGRLRRLLSKAIFPNFADFDPYIRKKNSVFGHLPTGHQPQFN